MFFVKILWAMFELCLASEELDFAIVPKGARRVSKAYTESKNEKSSRFDVINTIHSCGLCSKRKLQN